jgi:hypothetical protein
LPEYKSDRYKSGLGWNKKESGNKLAHNLKFKTKNPIFAPHFKRLFHFPCHNPETRCSTRFAECRGTAAGNKTQFIVND